MSSPAEVMFRAFMLTQSASNQTVLSPIPASMFFTSEHLRGSPYDVAVLPSSACAALSVATIVSVLTVGISSTFSLEIRDSFHNFRACEQDHWVRFFSMQPIAGAYATLGQSCSFSLVPGNSTVGFINIVVDNSYVFPEASAVVVMSGRLNLIRSTVRISSMTTAGVPVSFSVSLFDSINNPKDLHIFSSNIQIMLRDANHCGKQPCSADVQPAPALIARLPSFQFVVTVSAHYSVSVLFMNASFAQLPLVVVPASPCATRSFMIGDAVTLATNDAMSQFHLHLRDSFGNEAYLDSSAAVFACASTAPRFSCASVISTPSISRIPVSFSFKHTLSHPASALPRTNAMLAVVGGLTATSVFFLHL